MDFFYRLPLPPDVARESGCIGNQSKKVNELYSRTVLLVRKFGVFLDPHPPSAGMSYMEAPCPFRSPALFVQGVIRGPRPAHKSRKGEEGKESLSSGSLR